MAYEWLLFDADGTLFDYDGAEEKALTGTFDEFQIPFLPHYGEIYQTVNNNLWKLFEQGKISLEDLRVRRFFDLFFQAGLDANSEKFSERYLFHLGQSADLIPFALETLQLLEKEYHMAIITNGISKVQRSRLALSPIEAFFDGLFISEEIGYSKPAKGYFDVVMDALYHPAKDSVLVIGDSLSSDMRGGVNYGLDTCWFNPNATPNTLNLPVTYEIQDLRQIPNLLNKKSK